MNENIKIKWLDSLGLKGYYEFLLDEKSRIWIPSKLRNAKGLEEYPSLIFFAHPGRFEDYRYIRVTLLPPEKEKEVYEYYNSRPRDDLERRTFFCSIPGEVDVKNRILIKNLLDHIGIGIENREGSIIGGGNFFDIYNREEGRMFYNRLLGLDSK